MRIRSLLTVFAIVLLMGVPAAAQRRPPSPSTPPSPGIAVPVPVPPDAPMAFSFSLDGSSYLGVSPENITKENMSQYGLSVPRGVGVSNVSPGSPAERAGLKKGDVILQFDGEPVTSTRKLFRLIGESAPEQSVRLTISRNGSEQQINVTLGQRSPSARTFMPGRPDERGFFRVDPPSTPRGWTEAPEFFAYSFGNNRRVGITTTPLTKQLAEFFGVSVGHGLLISSVSENSPASKAGLKAGDVITEVNGEKIEDTGDFLRALNLKEEGEVTLTIIRDKSQRTIKVTPERRTPAPTFNLSGVQPPPMARGLIAPGRLMNLPDVRVLQAMPKFESFVLPKMDVLTVPRLPALPRVEMLPAIPREL